MPPHLRPTRLCWTRSCGCISNRRAPWTNTRSSGAFAAKFASLFLYFFSERGREKERRERERSRTPSFDTLSAYDEHLKKAHSRSLCSACSVSLWVWPDERAYFTKETLLAHFANGSPPIPPHPFCRYCNTPYFSDDELYVHEMTSHEVKSSREKNSTNSAGVSALFEKGSPSIVLHVSGTVLRVM